MDVSDTTILYGLVQFSSSLACAPDVSGCSIPISLGGVSGTLHFPKLPDFPAKGEGALDRPLIGPAPAISWKKGEQLVYWGRPTSYPAGNFHAETVLLEFRLPTTELEATATKAYEAFMSWRTNFEAHVEWLTEQRTWNGVRVTGDVDGLDMFSWGPNGNSYRPQQAKSPHLTIRMRSDRFLLGKDQLMQICERCSAGTEVPLEVEFLLDAYRAFAQGDYRKAVIDAATATELALTRAITAACLASGKDAQSLLNSKKMLGRRIGLAMDLGIVPTVFDLWVAIADPRNGAIHAGAVVAEAAARTAIKAVDTLLICLRLPDTAIKHQFGPGVNPGSAKWSELAA